jgi:hypothetical protein
MDPRQDDRVSRPRCFGEPDPADVVGPVEQLRDGCHRLRLAEDLEPDHWRRRYRDACPSGSPDSYDDAVSARSIGRSS